jgi:AmmeMemoRadiSam system protein A
MSESPHVQLARAAIEAYVQRGERRLPVDPIPAELQKPAACFVSVHKQDGRLRGCIGTIHPIEPTLAQEIARNAVAAATEDPRFLPIRAEELPGLEYSVDVLNEPEPVDSLERLDPKRYGVIVALGWRRGLLLPDLEGVNTVPLQVSIALEKAGIDPDEPFTISRFTVTRFH